MWTAFTIEKLLEQFAKSGFPVKAGTEVTEKNFHDVAFCNFRIRRWTDLEDRNKDENDSTVCKTSGARGRRLFFADLDTRTLSS